jgi:hypothetical protein
MWEGFRQVGFRSCVAGKRKRETAMREGMIHQPTQAEVGRREVTIRFPDGVCLPTEDEWNTLAAFIRHGTLKDAKPQARRCRQTIRRIVERYGPILADAIDGRQ